MKILLFGKNGMVGSAVAAQASAQAIELEAHGRDTADFTDPESCADIAMASNADAIINAAAYTAVDKAEDESDITMQVNGETVGAIAEAAARRKIPIVHISTDYVFSAAHDRPYLPNEPVDPINAYGASKLAGEQAIMQSGARYVILRTSWVFAATGANFVKTMLKLSESRDELNVVSDQIGGPTSAGSIAAACLTIARALLNKSGPTGIYHLSGTPDVSWADFARGIFRQAGKDVTVNDIPTSEYPTPAARPLNSRLDCAATKTDFDIDRPDWKADLNQVLSEEI